MPEQDAWVATGLQATPEPTSSAAPVPAASSDGWTDAGVKEEPSYWNKVKDNLPKSLWNFIRNQPTPTDSPVDPAGPKRTLTNPLLHKSVKAVDNPPSKLPDVGEVAHHVVKSITDFPEHFAEDPIGTVALPLQILRGGAELPAARTGARMAADLATSKDFGKAAIKSIPGADAAITSAKNAKSVLQQIKEAWARAAAKEKTDALINSPTQLSPQQQQVSQGVKDLQGQLQSTTPSVSPQPQGPLPQPQLPSGRVPGSIANQAPAPVPTPPVDRSSLLAQWLQQAKEKMPSTQTPPIETPIAAPTALPSGRVPGQSRPILGAEPKPTPTRTPLWQQPNTVKQMMSTKKSKDTLGLLLTDIEDFLKPR